MTQGFHAGEHPIRRRVRRGLRRTALALPILMACLAVSPSPASAQLLPSELSEVRPDSFKSIAESIVDLMDRARRGTLPAGEIATVEQAILIARQLENYTVTADDTSGHVEPDRAQKALAALALLQSGNADRDALARTAFDSLVETDDWRSLSAERSDQLVGRLVGLIYDMTDRVAQTNGYLMVARALRDRNEKPAAKEMLRSGIPVLRSVEPSSRRSQLAREYVAELIEAGGGDTAGSLTNIALSLPFGDERTLLIRDVLATADAKGGVLLGALSDKPTSLRTLPDAWEQLRRWHEREPASGEIAAAMSDAATAPDPRVAMLLFSTLADRAAVRAAASRTVGALLDSGDGFAAASLWKTVGEDAPDFSVLTRLAEHFSRKGYDRIAVGYADRVAGGDPNADEFAAAIAETYLDAGDESRLAELLSPARSAVWRAAAAEAVARLAVRKWDARVLSRLDSKTAGSSAGRVVSAMTDVLNKREGAVAAIEAAANAFSGSTALWREFGRQAARYPSGRAALAEILKRPLPSAAKFASAASATEQLAEPSGSPLIAAARAMLPADVPTSGRMEDADVWRVGLSVGGQAWTARLAQASGSAIAFAEASRRAVRNLAGRGDLEAAYALAAEAPRPDERERLEADVASIQAVADDFAEGTRRLKDLADHRVRIGAFRDVAVRKAEEMDLLGWLEPAGTPAAAGKPVVVRSAMRSERTALYGEGGLALYRASHDSLIAGPVRPPLPRFDRDSRSVTASVPMPRGGIGGVSNGGDGRLVRLSRFVSKSFEGVRNAGVGDYLYAQNSTITPDFIYLNDGVFTARDVLGLVVDARPTAMRIEERTVSFHLPIVIGADAALILSGEEASEFRLDRGTGSYIVNAGNLFVSDTRLVGYDFEADKPAFTGPDEASTRFRPFIVSWSGSRTSVVDSALVALGYASSKAYGLTITEGPVDDVLKKKGHWNADAVVINSSLENLYYGFYCSEVNDAVVTGNEFRNNIVYGIDPHDYSRRLLFSYNTAYGTYHKHGIIISRQVDDAFLVGNLSFHNAGSGLMLDRNSVGAIIYANNLLVNQGDGLSLFESSCNFLSRNRVASNGRSGIKLRNSWDVQVAGNAVEQNKGAGIEAYIDRLETAKSGETRNFVLDPYSPVVTATVIGNEIAGNGVGVRTLGLTELTAYANRFRNQSPKLFAGELARLNLHILQESGRSPTSVRSQCVPAIKNRTACPLADLGLVALQTEAEPYRSAGADADECVGAPGSVQARAFVAGN